MPALVARDVLARSISTPIDVIRLSRSRSSRTSRNLNQAWCKELEVEVARVVSEKDAFYFALPSWLRKCILHEKHPLRVFWTGLITVLLVYIGTVFLYRLTFIEFRLGSDMAKTLSFSSSAAATTAADAELHPEDLWELWDGVINIVFWFDLFVYFLFTFRDERLQEVHDPKRIAKHYLTTTFLVNALACVPEAVFEFIVTQFMDRFPNNLNQGLRVVRLRRVTRLARLVRATRLAKITAHAHGKRMMRWFERHKGARMLNLSVALLWIVHVLACGWYLVAVVHDEPDRTWVARRVVDCVTQETLLDRGSFHHWLHSMYFVIAVFTTVGFGDISAMTIGESIYCSGLMVVGVIFHSLIISEVIKAVTTIDRLNEFTSNQRELIDCFSDHTELREDARDEMTRWVFTSAKQMMREHYSKGDMEKLISGKYMPRGVLAKVPASLFKGRLASNRLLRCIRPFNPPPRLSMLLAMFSVKTTFKRGEIVYQVNDYPFNLFLVYSGVFAYVMHPPAREPCEPSPCADGIDVYQREPSKGTHSDIPPAVGMEPYQLFPCGTYFGDYEIFVNCPRSAAARCESFDGVLLCVARPHMKEVVGDFPEFAAEWRRLAGRREANRQAKMAGMRGGLQYGDLAAMAIQRCFRQSQLTVRSEWRRSRAAAYLWKKEEEEGGCSISPALLGRRINAAYSEGPTQQLGRRVDQLAEKVNRLTMSSGNDLKQINSKIDTLAAQMSLLLAATTGRSAPSKRPLSPGAGIAAVSLGTGATSAKQAAAALAAAQAEPPAPAPVLMQRQLASASQGSKWPQPPEGRWPQVSLPCCPQPSLTEPPGETLIQ